MSAYYTGCPSAQAFCIQLWTCRDQGLTQGQFISYNAHQLLFKFYLEQTIRQYNFILESNLWGVYDGGGLKLLNAKPIIMIISSYFRTVYTWCCNRC